MSLTYTIYKADYNPNTSYLDVDPIRDVFDQGNPTFDRNEQITANSKFERVVHRSLEHLYYRDFYTNNKASFGSGHIKKQERRLGDQAYVISIPQSKFGESILPGSVKINLDYSFLSYNSVIGYTVRSGTWTVVDDMYGNLYVSGSSDGNLNSNAYETPLGGVGGAYTDFTESISKSKPLVGEWPIDTIYKYVNAGPVTFTSSYDRGFWPMQSMMSNIQIVDTTALGDYPAGGLIPGTPYATLKNYIGVGGSISMLFKKNLQSYVELKSAVSHEYKQKYNFENGDYTIYMSFFIDGQSGPPSDCVLLAKEGPEEDIRVDKDGNIHKNNTSTKVPWKLTIENGNFVFSCQSGVNDVYKLLISPASGPWTWNSIGYGSLMVVKSGSNITLWLTAANGIASYVTGTIPYSDKTISNKANIFVGNSYKKTEGFDGVIGTVKIYKGALSYMEQYILNTTCGLGSTKVGNVFYNHGMMVLTAAPAVRADITAVECRGTHTIWENEISCTVAPGDFGMSSNPTLEEYNAETDQYEYRPFVTGSAFKPFITTIGLYDNLGRLLVVGKLNTPIQTPDNTDTTFIVRYDR